MGRILLEDHPHIRAVDPRTWIRHTGYPDLPFARSFEAFLAQRSALLDVLRPLDAVAWQRAATVTGGARQRERSVRDYADWLATHERRHAPHIARILRAVAG